MVLRSLVASTAGAALAVVLAPPASAGVEPPNFLMTWDVSNDDVGPNTYNWKQFGTLNPFGDYTVPKDPNTWTGWNYTGVLMGPQERWSLEWNCVFFDASGGAGTGTSAFVVANIVVTNFSANTEEFTLLMSNPLARPINPTFERGSIVGTLTDLAGNGATVSAPVGAQIYTARIDGADESELMEDPFSVSTFTSTPVGPEGFGLPPLPNGIPASQKAENEIAIFLDFNLTGFDSASFTSIYEVQIPAPAVLPFLAAFGLLGGRRRRS